MFVQQILHLLPDRGIDDRGMFARVHFMLVADFAHVDDIAQQFVQPRLGERPPAARVSFARQPTFVEPATPRKLLAHRQERLVLQV